MVEQKSVYDNTSRTLTTTSPEGRTTVQTFDAKSRLISEKVGNLTPTTYQYNATGQLTAVLSGTRKYSFTYNAQGLMASIIDPLNNKTNYFYDKNGRVLSLTRADGTIFQTAYDALDNVTSVTNLNAKKYGYGYDKNQNLLSNVEPAIGGAATNWSFTYNKDDQPLSVAAPAKNTVLSTYNADGTLNKLSGTKFSQAYSWYQGLLQSVTTGNKETLSLFYSNDLPSQETWSGPVAGTVNYSWLSFNRLDSVGVESSSVRYQYDNDYLPIATDHISLSRSAATGLIDAAVSENVNTQYSYNAFGEMSEMSASKLSSNLLDIKYSRDALGRISGMTGSIQGKALQKAFIFDSVGRLKSEQLGTVTTNYTYDHNGNRSTSGGAEIYDDQDRLVSNSLWAYTYDLNGTLTHKASKGSAGTVDYTYDDLGRLTAVKFSNGTKVEYLVDGMGRRVQKKVNGAVKSGFLYLDDLRPIAELNPNGTMKSIFEYLDGSLTPQVMVKDGVSYRIVSDHLGSPLFVINASSGVIAQAMTYDTWGRVLTNSNPGFQPFGFAGGHYDAETGLVRFGARDYDASIGRWIDKDPIRFNGGYNFYVYADNNPVNFVDSKGLDVTIYYYESFPGHIGLAVGSDPSFGYYGGNAYLYGIPSPQYVRYGSIQRDSLMQDETPQTITIKTTQQQDEKIRLYLKDVGRNPGEYNLFFNNCTTNAADALRAGGVEVPHTFIPYIFYETMLNRH